jgi:hypothetical protein
MNPMNLSSMPYPRQTQPSFDRRAWQSTHDTHMHPWTNHEHVPLAILPKQAW